MNTRLTTLTIVVIAALALPIAGCGGDDEDSTAPETEATAAVATGDETSLPEPVSASGAKRFELEDRLLTRLSLPSADWMVAAFDSLWVKQDDGRVVRVDPGTGKVIAETGSVSSGHSCQGIGASAEAIWSCPPSGAVERIDPKTNSIAATVRVDKLPDQGRLVSAAGRVWVLTGSGSKLAGIDPAKNKPAATIALDGDCVDLAADGATVWAMCPFEDRVLRIDAATGEVTDELELAGAANGVVGDDLWVAFEGGVAQVDLESLDVLAVYEVHPRWVREEGGSFLTRIDPEAQRIVETINARDLPSGGDVVQIGDSVWATAYDDATLVELSATG
jgi:streptogramin lyase